MENSPNTHLSSLNKPSGGRIVELCRRKRGQLFSASRRTCRRPVHSSHDEHFPILEQSSRIAFSEVNIVPVEVKTSLTTCPDALLMQTLRPTREIINSRR